MNDLLLKIVTRMNKRLAITVLGIAVCIMYLVGTSILIQGLDVGTAEVGSLTQKGFYIVFDENTLSESRLDSSEIDRWPGVYSTGTMLPVTVEVDGGATLDTFLMVVDDDDNLIGLGEVQLSTEVLPGIDLDIPRGSSINLTWAQGSMPTRATQDFNPYSSQIFSDDMILASRSLGEIIQPDIIGKVSFVILPAENYEAIAIARDAGYHVKQSVGMLDFFEQGVNQVEADLWGLVGISAVIIILMVYSILSIEIQFRTPEIRIIKYLGLGPRDVLCLFLIQAAYLGLLGGLIGASLGIVIANSLTSVAPMFGLKSMIYPAVSFTSLGIPLALSVGASIIGGFYPAYKASCTSVRGMREVL